jgi:hypothetical protein
MFCISVMDTCRIRSTLMRPGRPTAPAIVQALKLGMTHPKAPLECEHLPPAARCLLGRLVLLAGCLTPGC